MPRSYAHMSDHEKEIIELRKQGLTYREIGEEFGFSKKQIKNFLIGIKERNENLNQE